MNNPSLRIYAFDYNLDLSVIRTLKSIYKLSGELPAIVIDRVPYYGFKNKENILSLIPGLKAPLSATSTGTSTRQ